MGGIQLKTEIQGLMMFEFFLLSPAQEEITNKISQKPRMNAGGLRMTQQVFTHQIKYNQIYFLNSARLSAYILRRLQ